MEKIHLDEFNVNSVVVVTNQVDDSGFALKTHRNGFDNSVSGRKRLEKDVPEPYKTVVMMLWGDTPTIVE